MRLLCFTILLFFVAETCGSVTSIHRVLMPLSLKNKLCEQNPDLKICHQVHQAQQPRNFEYSFWDVCDSRPYIPLCRLRPEELTKEPQHQHKEYEPEVEGSGMEESEVPLKKPEFIHKNIMLQPNDL